MCGITKRPSSLRYGKWSYYWPADHCIVHNYNHGSQNARLHFKGDPLTHVSAGWAARLLDTKQWLQVDLQHITRVIGIATQGRHDFDQWVIEYKLQYGDDGQTYSVYSRSGDTSETVWILMAFWTKCFFSSCWEGGTTKENSSLQCTNATPQPPDRQLDYYEVHHIFKYELFFFCFWWVWDEVE